MTRHASEAHRPIRRLSAETVERIAAGEVVDRPASVAKELVENALDAGARTVTIRLDGGGLERIEVADDGVGIPKDQLGLAVERHATSKLDPEGPIDRIVSLGFRGEALASIASVSHLKVLSRPAGEESAAGLSAESGRKPKPFAASRAPGTTVEVRDLFYNTPARRKFMRSPAAEQVEVVATVERLYLARPGVTYHVRSGDRELAVYPATGDPRDAAARVLGPALLRESFRVEGAVPGGKVFGILGRPSTAGPSSRALHLSVNGRAVNSRGLAQAVRVAFGDSIPKARYPVGVLGLDLDPTYVDVNVHPTKREVRFLRERELSDALRGLVRVALLDNRGVGPLADGLMSLRPAPPRSSATPLTGSAARSLGTAALAMSTRQQRLSSGTTPGALLATRVTPLHPKIELVGCVARLYWVAESQGALVLIDQHAASERVVYEMLRRQGTLARQSLVDPVTVQLSGSARAALVEHAEVVRAAGFEVDEFGPDTFRVRSVPEYRGRRARPEALAELLDELASGGRPTLPDGLEERVAASVACHASIRAGDEVSPTEFLRVLDGLFELPEALYTCPHGRPILLQLPRSRLDQWFLRAGA
jgi:DNA mismatch repair protein MutL